MHPDQLGARELRCQILQIEALVDGITSARVVELEFQQGRSG